MVPGRDNLPGWLTHWVYQSNRRRIGPRHLIGGQSQPARGRGNRGLACGDGRSTEPLSPAAGHVDAPRRREAASPSRPPIERGPVVLTRGPGDRPGDNPITGSKRREHRPAGTDLREIEWQSMQGSRQSSPDTARKPSATELLHGREIWGLRHRSNSGGLASPSLSPTPGIGIGLRDGPGWKSHA